jgi:2-polyprenyl-3-methyl-5-hydroxy-6-metoxy-1,4-benzoquinol methylase
MQIHAKLVAAPCPACGSQTRVEIYPGTISLENLHILRSYSYDTLLDGHHPIMQCTSCGLHYACPRDSWETLEQVYTTGSVESYLKETEGKLASFKREAHFLRELCGTGGVLLEIGCATGLFLRAATEVGFSVQGCEPWKEAATIAQQAFGSRVKIGTFRAVDYASKHFRVVALWGVIEHVEEPAQILRDIYDLLMPGGWLALSTPNFQSLSRRLLRSRWHFFERPHLTFFDPESISNLLRAIGYADIRIRAEWVTYSTSYLASYLAKWSAAGSRAFLRLDNMIPSRLGLKLTLPNGAMHVYARKAL